MAMVPREESIQSLFKEGDLDTSPIHANTLAIASSVLKRIFYLEYEEQKHAKGKPVFLLFLTPQLSNVPKIFHCPNSKLVIYT